MAAPEHVPVDRSRLVRTYESPPRRPEPWLADRPAELPIGQPEGKRFGNQGPDQGYALLLAQRYAGKLTLRAGEHERDALAGAVAVGLKRASSFGRAPILPDITVGLTIWGFLGDAPDELVELRRGLFEEVSHPHHYMELRRIADLVPEDVLRRPSTEIAEAVRRDWRSAIAPGASSH